MNYFTLEFLCKGGLKSALGQKQTFAPQKAISALPPIADIRGAK
jgi:hypothetical protein